ncbi:putative Histidine kinase [Desulfamplus magnetovallimortis]|uniref:histidine kinase n=1 Tax=Desulfamplus magnetovallimortis TaxID=1246637 RepID=A0A1W1HJA0_9BACT|nr:HAMP domain-containing sensor histidine kinase [Desulfamplus magnetovallimortis]SLM32516.1 putative Histidine kinase [Desulfamplus magnetovallimortis]
MFRKRTAAVLAGGILVLFLSFLLIVNYRSLIRLQESALTQFVQNLDKQAGAISYFFSERIIDMKNLAGAREGNIFFENKALGMSMAYGLRASLVQIDKRFDRLMEEKKMGEDPIYARIVFVDESGGLLSDRRREIQKNHKESIDWYTFLTPENPEPAIMAFFVSNHMDIIISIPYYFKNHYKGQIIAWLNCGAVNNMLSKKGGTIDALHLYIDFGIYEKYLNDASFCAGSDIHLLTMIRKTAPLQTLFFDLSGSDGKKIHYAGAKAAIAGTPFFLVMAMPAGEMVGHATPMHLLIAMIVLALFVTGAALLLWRMDARELVLTARLREESMRKKAVEKVVQERTLELKQTQKELLSKAVDAGRAQLAAMVLHNIGNAVTPVGVNMEKLKKSKIKAMIYYLNQCYKDLTAHQENLTEYVTKDSRGVQIIQYMGALLDDIEKERKKAAKLLNNATAAIEYVSQVLSLQRSYAPSGKEMKESVLMNFVVEDALKIQEATISKRNIEIEKELMSDLPRISIEKNKLMQVVVNFIKNSCDAIDENTEIENHTISIKTVCDDKNLVLTITDTGCGVEPEKLNDIFEFGISTKGSSGFGLYYCKSFVEANNGTLTLESSGKNRGATVMMSFRHDKQS